MKLFVSYRRKSWPFTSQLVNNLRRRLDVDIFVDYQGVDETDFEKSILRHLRNSDAVLLIVSEYTFAPLRIQQHDDWVRREIREALALNKPVVAVFIDGQGFPSDLPADIRDIRGKQGISFYPEYFAAGVKRLAEFMIRVTPVKPAPLNNFDDDDDETADGLPDFKATFVDAMRLFVEGDFDKSIFVLEELRDNGYAHQFVSLAGVLEDAKHQRDLERRLQDARVAYSDIAALAKSKVMRDRACAAWKAFQIAYPDFHEDVENLAEKLSLSVPFRLIVPPVPKQIEEIIVFGSDRSAHDLSLDDVLRFFATSPVDAAAGNAIVQPPDAKKGASLEESARKTQEAKRI